MSDETAIDRVQAFLDIIEKDTFRNISLDVYSAQQDDGVVANLRWADVQMLVALAKASMEVEGNLHFLNLGQRAVVGWKRAVDNQIETIGRLQEHLRLARISYKELSTSLDDCRRQNKTLVQEAREAQDWQNEVAQLIPEDGWSYNPESAQEGIILDYIKHLQSQNQLLGIENTNLNQETVTLHEVLDVSERDD